MRDKHITVNLTQEESDIIQALADIYDRKLADMARILLTRAAFAEWVKVQARKHDGAPFTRPTFTGE